jgi:hypothetical protein
LSDPPIAVPMNKVVLGKSTLPNLRGIRSKVGSMANSSYKVTHYGRSVPNELQPGGGQVRIVNKPVRKPKPRSRTRSESAKEVRDSWRDVGPVEDIAPAVE